MSLDFNELIVGMSLAYQGFRKALDRPKILRYFYKSFLFLAVSMLILYILASIFLYSPLYVLKSVNYALGKSLGYDIKFFNLLLDEALATLRSRIIALPLSGLFVFRYVYPYPMNNIFLSSVQTISAAHYGPLSQREYKLNYWAELLESVSRTAKRLKNILLVVGLSQVPKVGVFVVPLATFYFTYKVIGLKPYLALSALPLVVPGTKPFALWLLSTVYGTRALSRELLEPYFGRLGFTAKERVTFFREKESILLGFSLGYYILISNISVIGPIFYVFAQSAIATFIVKTTPPLEPVSDKKSCGSSF